MIRFSFLWGTPLPTLAALTARSLAALEAASGRPVVHMSYGKPSEEYRPHLHQDSHQDAQEGEGQKSIQINLKMGEVLLRRTLSAFETDGNYGCVV